MKFFYSILILVVLCFVTFTSAYSQESTTESWYTYWGLGYASVSYPTELQELIDILKDQPSVSNISLSLDILGFYWHITPKTIGGVIINGVGDRFSVNQNWMQINQYLYSASAMHYLGQSFGSGIFLRADAGLARIVVQESGGISAGSDSGFGILAGGGWSFDFGGTRLLLNFNYAYRGIEGETYNTLNFSVGGLF